MWPFTRSGRPDAPEIGRIDVTTAFARSKRGAKLVDVRSAREFSSGHPKGARSLPPQRIKNDDTGLARDDEILVICLSGHRSSRQAKKLARLGYTNVSEVQGGLMAWKKAGLPVKK